MPLDDLGYYIDTFTHEANTYSEQARINQSHGLEPSDAYWRGRAQGLLDARDLLLNIRRSKASVSIPS